MNDIEQESHRCEDWIYLTNSSEWRCIICDKTVPSQFPIAESD